MSNSIQINGILLNEETIDVLKKWQMKIGDNNSSTVECYVNYLNDTQDCITRVMLENGITEMAVFGDILTKLICIKDDLKLFANS